MLTDNKEISSPEYWNGLFSGKRNDAKVDPSNGKRTTTFDRFTIVADLVEGVNVLEVAAGHARISAMVKANHRDWDVVATDQSNEALIISKYQPYFICSVYNIEFKNKCFDTLICTQAFEYFEHLDKALTEFKRVTKKAVFTFPKGEMSSWSQLYIFTPESVNELLEPYGEIEVFQEYDHLILVKIKFNE